MNAPMKTPAKDNVTALEAPAPAVAEAAAPQAPEKKKGGSRRLFFMVSVPLVLAVGGGYFWLNGGRFVDTDNAYVQQTKVALSADIAGRVTEVSVNENEIVKAGQVLFRIDPAPYKIALDQAEAALASARVSVDQLRVSYGTAEAKLKAAQETLDIRQTEMTRKDTLVGQGLAAQSTLDDVKIAYQSAQTAVSLANQEVASTVAALAGNPAIATEDHPAVRTALAAKDSAERNLAKTTVQAPADGIVSQVANLNVGQFVSVGTTIASLVETGDTWIQANFKETQLATLVAGQKVEVAVDAFPGLKLEGHVDSIGAATGSEFALIPAQNATGNWVKVTQRIPVRVKVDGSTPDLLRSGMSATVSVDTGKTVLDAMLAPKTL